MALPAMTQPEMRAALERQRASNRNRTEREHRLEQAIVRKAITGLTAAGYGAVRRFGVARDIKGFPWKLGVWALLTIGEVVTKRTTQTILGAAADMTMGSYTENAVAEGTFVAGGSIEGGSIE